MRVGRQMKSAGTKNTSTAAAFMAMKVLAGESLSIFQEKPFCAGAH